MRVRSTNIYVAWRELLWHVIHSGTECAPRGQKIKEILGTQLVVTDMRNNILVDPYRDLNYRFLVAEWLWILGGRNDVETVARYNKPIAAFSDDGKTFAGAYGPRLLPQWDYLRDTLRRDRDSRQAVASIWTPCPSGTKDVPCTLTLQALIREGVLHGIMTIRSNDLWLGLPYDFFNFSQFCIGLAGDLDAVPGSMTIQAGSSHIYVDPGRDGEKVTELLRHHAGHYLRSPRLHRSPPAEAIWADVNGITRRFPPMIDENEMAYEEVLRCSGKSEALQILAGCSILSKQDR